MKSGKGGGNICNHLPCTRAQFKVFRKCSNLMLMEKRLGTLFFLDPNYGNSSGKEKTWHISMISKYADPVGTRHTHKKETTLCSKDLRGKKTQKIKKMWGMKLFLPLPQRGLLRKAFGLQMQVFPMIPRQDYFIGAPDIALILPWLDHSEERARSPAEWEEEEGHVLIPWVNQRGDQPLPEPGLPLCCWMCPRVHPALSPLPVFCQPITSSQRTQHMRTYCYSVFR